MRKLLISLMLAGLLTMATVVPAFAQGRSAGAGNKACENPVAVVLDEIDGLGVIDCG